METIPEGYLGNLTPSQEKVVSDLRVSLKNELSRHPEISTKWSLLRFCRARNFDFKKTEEMVKKCLEWRDKRNMDRIRNRDFSDYSKIIDHHESGRYGIDKQGRPFIIERVGLSDTKSIMTQSDFNTIEDYFIQLYERSMFIEFPIASATAGRRIDETFLIIDLKNVQVSKVFDSNLKEFLKFIILISQDYYPEMLGKMFIINAPFLFKGIWAFLKILLDKKTKSKIDMYSDIPLKEIEKYIDIDNLPSFLNGKCVTSLKENIGPWREEIEESRIRKSFFLRDRTPEFKYFYDEEEKNTIADFISKKEVELQEIEEGLSQLKVEHIDKETDSEVKDVCNTIIENKEELIIENETSPERIDTVYLEELAQNESDIIHESEPNKVTTALKTVADIV